MVGSEANPAGPGIRVGAWVQVAGRRGRFRVIAVTAHGVELRDRDERWHVVRFEKVRPAGPVALVPKKQP